MELVEKYLHYLFPLWGIRFVGLADNADTENKGNKKQRQINGLINEWYCEDVSENIRYVFDNKRREGKFIGSFATYGYLKDPTEKGKLIVDEAAASIVRRIYNLYVNGYGSTPIARLLNEEGIPNPTLYKNLNGIFWKRNAVDTDLGLWNRTTIKRILKNEMYLGNMVQGVHKKASYKSKTQLTMPKESWFIVQGTHAPIIDEETFQTAQQLRQIKRRTDGKGIPHVLAGKVKCADCGSTLSRITPHKRNGEEFPYKYLRCSMVNKNPTICKGHYIRLDKLEDVVLARLKLHFKNIINESIEENLKNIKKQKDLSNDKVALRNIESEIRKKEKILEVLYSDKATEVITMDEYVQMSSSFKKQLNILKDNQLNIISKMERSETNRSNDETILQKINQFKNAEVLTVQMVNEFIERIEVSEKNPVTKEQEINIYWRF